MYAVLILKENSDLVKRLSDHQKKILISKRKIEDFATKRHLYMVEQGNGVEVL
jgi:hypothetical protein